MFQSIPTQRPLTPLLDSINDPADLRLLDEGELSKLAEQLRAFLLYTVGQTGGHFGAGLGVVELTIALHRLFNTPVDHLVWDVGHQTYPHKILTGRREQMQSLRQPDGIAPFPSRAESPYDVFGTGHSSTSISAALGLALADQIHGRSHQSVVVIGDGAMTAGMAFEALNHVAACQADVLVVLNDNAMSISENVGGLANYFARNISAGAADRLPGDTVDHTPGQLFSDLGFEYAGPVDGHNLPILMNAITNLKEKKGPRLLHVITIKGKGYGPAEASPVQSHSLTKLEKAEQITGPTYSRIFGQWLCSTAAEDEHLVAITPAMKEGSGLTEFAQLFPDRFHDVAIAEQHAVTLAAGLAAGGARPVVAIYSTFLQRAFDQLIHDVAIQNLDVLFAVDRAGLLEDGPTHSGVFDLSFVRAVPNLILMAPANSQMAKAMLTLGFEHPGPALVRYPRGEALQQDDPVPELEFGQGAVIRKGEKIALLSFGACLENSLEAASRHNCTVADMRFIKPLDERLIENLATSHQLLITIEENVAMGGAGSAVRELLGELGSNTACVTIGIPDRFIEQDEPDEMLHQAGLSVAGIESVILAGLERVQS